MTTATSCVCLYRKEDVLNNKVLNERVAEDKNHHVL